MIKNWITGDILINKEGSDFCVYVDLVSEEDTFAATLKVNNQRYDYFDDLEDGVDWYLRKNYRLANAEEIKEFHKLLHKFNVDWNDKTKTLSSWA